MGEQYTQEDTRTDEVKSEQNQAYWAPEDMKNGASSPVSSENENSELQKELNAAGVISQRVEKLSTLDVMSDNYASSLVGIVDDWSRLENKQARQTVADKLILNLSGEANHLISKLVDNPTDFPATAPVQMRYMQLLTNIQTIQIISATKG